MNPSLLPETRSGVPSTGLSIGEVARLTGLSVETLRYYEREDLLLEPARRDGGGRRRYSADDIAWIEGLIMLRETGMPIADIRVMAELSRRAGTEAERLVLLEAHRRHALAEVAKWRRHIVALEKKIASYREVVEREKQGQR